MSQGALAVILARAGSKGLPNKNTLPIAGKPMLVWTIEHALKSKRIDRVRVTTDGEALAEIARRAGAEVVLRPGELATDTATVDAAARHAVIDRIDLHETICLLYGNVPVRPAALSDRAIAMLQDTGADSVQSVCAVGKHHPYWMKTVDAKTGAINSYQDNAVYRRQDLPPVFGLDGGVIAVTRASLYRVIEGEPHAFLGKDRRGVITMPGEVIDVDDHADFAVAEAALYAKARKLTGRSAAG